VILIGSAVVLTGAIASVAYLYYKDTELSEDVENENNHKLSYFYSKSKLSPQNQLIKIIDDAKESIDIAVYYITETKIVTHLCTATKRGIKVRIITDQDDSYQQSALEKIMNAGIPIKINTYEGKMHLKNMIIVQKIITSGSYNFTQNAEKKNEEVLIISDDKKVAKEWSEKFEEMWNDNINYSPYRPRAVRKFA
jgi:phosphatidylserine/phosphatidylglycerophosphate/cardiolipin synthase-like enzyme